MSRLREEKLQVTFASGTDLDGSIVPRTYTLTHSDLTGDLFLTVAPEYDRKQYAGLYSRLMRDEVLAEWSVDQEGITLHVHCHISGRQPAFGSARMRLAIFKRELPLVLEALRVGDRRFFDARPEADGAPIIVHFHARQPEYDRVERWGVPADYDPEHEGEA